MVNFWWHAAHTHLGIAHAHVGGLELSGEAEVSQKTKRDTNTKHNTNNQSDKTADGQSGNFVHIVLISVEVDIRRLHIHSRAKSSIEIGAASLAGRDATDVGWIEVGLGIVICVDAVAEGAEIIRLLRQSIDFTVQFLLLVTDSV